MGLDLERRAGVYSCLRVQHMEKIITFFENKIRPDDDKTVTTTKAL